MTVERLAVDRAHAADLAARVAQRLREGAVCLLPSETVYGLAAEEARALEPGPTPTLHCRDLAEAERHVDLSDPRLHRLAHRYWPGPLSIEAPSRTDPATTLRVRVPSHAFLQAVAKHLDAPLPMRLLPAGTTSESALASLAPHPHLVADAGPCALGSPPTEVRLDGPCVAVAHEGILSAAEVMTTAAVSILFVCTGNTCRSPLAEVLARAAVAKALGCAPKDVLARGLKFASAGTGTMDGVPASEGSRLAAQEIGLDLSAHQSTSLRAEQARKAAAVYCLSHSHLEALQDQAPDLEGKAQLLRPDGRDVADPYGGPLPVYRKTRDEIAAAIETRVDEWLRLLPESARRSKRS